MRTVLLFTGCVLVVVGCESPLESSGPCTSGTSHTQGFTITGAVANGDCEDPYGNVGDVYKITAPGSGQTFRTEIALTTSGFTGAIIVYAGDITTGAATAVFEDEGSSTLGAKLALQPGIYSVFVSSDGRKGGNYTLTAGPWSSLEGCDDYWTMVGAVINAMATISDCAGAVVTQPASVGPHPVRFDKYHLRLARGQSVIVNTTVPWMSGPYTSVAVWHGGQVVQEKQVQPGASNEISYTAPNDEDDLTVFVFSDPQLISGAGVPYTLSIR